MGHNLNLVHLEGAGVQDLARLGLVPTGEIRTGDDATSLLAPGPAAHVTPRGLLVADALMTVADRQAELAVALGTTVVSVLVASTGDVYSLAVATADGDHRHVVDSQGERVMDEGRPLPEEAGIDALDEDSTLGLLERLTGVRLDGDLLAGDFEVLAERA
ncbi:hypothetical protein C8046_09710 [Serinibacter arcticus]|uniref:Uncharacterized protein n=1 Tax=Serinibacter arcticus TaxID=1655435 RepID=A0A2U1ZV74_9MICO|nr:hypothetical protein [Serinibacter arcticus]PWD50886.1 hypothetical protein C8046_09710 [Serinibacter arcticus]